MYYIFNLQGVTRTKYATDVVGAVLKEMRDQSTQGK